MGSRANIVIQERRGGRVYLYSHWGGYELPLALQNALPSALDRLRILDDQYATRQLVHALGNNVSGISTYLGDNSYPLLVVDVARGVIRIEAEGRDRSTSDAVELKPGMEWTFEKFIELPLDGSRGGWYILREETTKC